MVVDKNYNLFCLGYLTKGSFINVMTTIDDYGSLCRIHISQLINGCDLKDSLRYFIDDTNHVYYVV